MIEVHMEQNAEGTKEEVAIIFTVSQLSKLKDVINSTYMDSLKSDGAETRYLKVSGVIRNP